MYTLIIVDDDELIRKGLERVIQWEQIGFRVSRTFASPSEALAYLSDDAADVLLTDIRMPEMTGLELIEAAKKLRAGIRSVIISGYGEFELARHAMLLRVEDYLLKPLGEEEIEAVFRNLKKILDHERIGAEEGKQEMRTEYELMKLLNHRIHVAALFPDQGSGRQYYEMLFIRLGESRNEEGIREGRNCIALLRQIFIDSFYVSLDSCFACLVLPEHLNHILMRLKRECLQFHELVCQIFIGREVYSEAEVVSAYWSAVELGKGQQGSGVFHYERERSIYKKEWDQVQEIKNRMIADFENGRYQEIDVLAGRIDALLSHYGSKERFYFYSNIISKMVRYFELEQGGGGFFFTRHTAAGMDRQYPDEEQLRIAFSQDIAMIRKTLWDNSDTMRSLIVGKAKAMIDKEYAKSELSLAVVANQLNISYGYLSTIFTKSVGYSFKTYLVEVRMEKARQLLLSRTYRIYEIAEMVGYKNPRYFTDAFKRYYNYSPMDYITRFRGEQDDNG